MLRHRIPNLHECRYVQTVDWQRPGGSSGNVDASTTRNELTPRTLPFVSTTAFGFDAFPMAPIRAVNSTDLSSQGSQELKSLHVPTVMNRRQGSLDCFENLCIRLYVRAREEFRANGDAACICQIAGYFQPLHSDFLIRRGEQPIWTDHRHVISVCGVDGNGSTRERSCAGDGKGGVVVSVFNRNVGGS